MGEIGHKRTKEKGLGSPACRKKVADALGRRWRVSRHRLPGLSTQEGRSGIADDGDSPSLKEAHRTAPCPSAFAPPSRGLPALASVVDIAQSGSKL